MKIEKVIRDSFAVIGKEGSTAEGEGFIQRLWADANAHYDEVAPLAKKDESGTPLGVWGAMSDLTRSFKPWEDFRSGLYLAGVECPLDAQAPAGWVKWVVPAYEYLRAENDSADAFAQGLRYLDENGYTLAGAVHEFTDPKTGKGYLFYPIRRL